MLAYFRVNGKLVEFIQEPPFLKLNYNSNMFGNFEDYATSLAECKEKL